MALEQLSLAAVDGGDDGGRAVTVAVEGGDDGGRAPRLPRWTRQEILVLIQGKRVAESRVRRGRTAVMEIGAGQAEPKWASVASYCQRHGVNRGPVQCRKRWSNLAGDYKKIKEWESIAKEDSDSYWIMRNDLRRERKLPGFFDREVFNILDGAPPPPAALSPPPPKEETMDSTEEPVFDSRRSAAAEDGLFSDHEDGGGTPEKEAPAAIPTPMPISEKQYQPIPRPSQAQTGPRPSQAQGTSTDKQPASAAEPGSASRERHKRKKPASDLDDEPTSLQAQMMDIMQRNGTMLSAQLEAHNANLELEREQRRDRDRSIVAALNKVADALVRIADKL